MKQKDKHYTAFNEKWFEKNQRIVLLAFRIIYKLFPSLLFKSHEQDDFGKNKIIEVGNNHATCDAGLQFFKKSELIKTASENPVNNHKDRRIYKTILRKMRQGKIKEETKLLPARKTVFFTDWNYSKMLYNAFKPVWWAMHYWDELVADRWMPSLSFGFSELTQYPDAGTGSTTVDGSVKRAGQTTESWATLRAGAGTDADNTLANNMCVAIGSWVDTDTWNYILRGIFTYDTSALTSGATISAVVNSIYSTGGADDLSVTPNIDIYLATPASNNILVAADYGQTGSTSQTGSPISYATWTGSNAYKDFTFNVYTGISKTGITRLSTRNASYDVSGTPPTWSSGIQSYFLCYFADFGSNKPKLVVTFSVSSVSNFFNFL